MRGHIRSPRRFFHGLLLLALLKWDLLSVTISATKFDRDGETNSMAEVQRSMARYRYLLGHNRSESMRDRLQVDQESSKSSQHPVKKERTIAKSKSNLRGPAHAHLQVEKVTSRESVQGKSRVSVQGKSQEPVQEEQKMAKSKSNLIGPAHADLQEEEKGKSRDPVQEEQKSAEEPPSFVFPEPYVLGPKISNWDEQRASWLEANPHMKTAPEGKPRVLMVTGSQPEQCQSPTGDHFHVKSLKLKIDYARIHKYEIYYNFVWLDPLFGSYWVKLPTLRKLMLTHPEIEWFFWVDSDAIFTDMLFEPPFQSYDQEGHNMIMWSWEYGFYQLKSWISVNVGVFMIRNCQWSLDLFDKWSPMGPQGQVRNEYGKMLSSFLPDRYDNYPADDQSALIYLMLTDEAVLSKIKLVEVDYMISGYWVEMIGFYDRALEKYHPGLGDRRWPWITHFTGCSPCAGGNNPDHSYESCMANFTIAYNFADNQVLAYMGFRHKSLSSREVISTQNETDRPLESLGVNPWQERIRQVAAGEPAQ